MITQYEQSKNGFWIWKTTGTETKRVLFLNNDFLNSISKAIERGTLK